MYFRSNNIGILPASSLPSSKGKTLCIVKYHPNRYKGTLTEYLADGWVDHGKYIEAHGDRLDKSVFLKDEDHYVLAFVHLYVDEPTTHLESVEDRPAYLEEPEFADFFRAYQEANMILLKNPPAQF